MIAWAIRHSAERSYIWGLSLSDRKLLEQGFPVQQQLPHSGGGDPAKHCCVRACTLPRVKRDLLMEEASFSVPFSALVSFTRSLPACAPSTLG